MFLSAASRRVFFDRLTISPIPRTRPATVSGGRGGRDVAFLQSARDAYPDRSEPPRRSYRFRVAHARIIGGARREFSRRLSPRRTESHVIVRIINRLSGDIGGEIRCYRCCLLRGCRGAGKGDRWTTEKISAVFSFSLSLYFPSSWRSPP